MTAVASAKPVESPIPPAASAGLAERLHMREEEWRIVAGILRYRLAGRSVWAFGSRATGMSLKRFSDLDLAVAGSLSWPERAVIREEFDESLVSFRVDLVELDLVDAEFRQRIERDFVALQ